MQRALAEVERHRLEMQRASERIQVSDGTPADGTLVMKRKKKKSKQPELVDAQASAHKVKVKKSKKKEKTEDGYKEEGNSEKTTGEGRSL